MTDDILLPPRKWASPRTWIGLGIGVALLILFAIAPLLPLSTGGILPGLLNSPGSLKVLCFVFVIAALAVSFDVVLGYGGLFSFGHALYFALGSYGYVMSMNYLDIGFGWSVVVGIVAAAVGALLVNLVALRASGIAFSMFTLAVTQIVFVLVYRNYFGAGGDEGLVVPYQKLPDALVGVKNTQNVYWICLGVLLAVFLIAKWITSTKLGHMWQAVRENELRVQVMGKNVYAVKLSAVMTGSVLAGVAGVGYSIALGSADPQVTGLFYSLGLIVMLIIGGKGRIWGAVIGAAIYVLLEQRLPALTLSEGIQSLPDWAQIPLSEPGLLLGVIFIVFIFALPGGLASVISNIGRPKSQRVSATGH
ncbi:MAG: branched-chain amino acid ABC transporter permease [Aeromicrobium sp.]